MIMKKDTSLMIKDFLEDGSHVTMMNYPKGSGKTSNIKMLANFFDTTKDSKEIFKGSKIMDTPYVNEMNQYPTVFLSFTNAIGNKEEVIECIKTQIKKEYERYSFIFVELDEFDIHNYFRIINGFENKSNTLYEIDDSLVFLMRSLEKYYNKNVMVFIDDYDIPFEEARVGNFYDEVGNPLYIMFHAAFKTSDALKYGLLMGTQNVLISDSIGGGLNNLMIHNVKYNKYSFYFKQSHQEMINENIIIMIKEAKDARFIGRLINKFLEDGSIETPIDLFKSYYEVKESYCFWGMLVNEGILNIVDSRPSTVFSYQTIYRLEFSNDKLKEQFIKTVNDKN